MGYHARLSPSSAHRWTSCTASIKAQEGMPNNSNEDARQGTCCHQISAECLINKTPDAQDYLGRVLLFWRHDESGSEGESWEDELDATFLDVHYSVTVTQTMVDAVDRYISYVRNAVELTGSVLFVEQRVPIEHITGEGDWVLGEEIVPEGTPGATWRPASGSSDTVMIAPGVLQIMDAKFGRKKVMAYDVIEGESIDMVTGEIIAPVLRMNLQLALYALGTLKEYGEWFDFTHVKVTIVQPFLDHVSEYSCPVEELLALGEWLKERAALTRTNPVYDPSENNCHFCRASGRCQPQTDAVIKMVFDEFARDVDIDKIEPRKIYHNDLGSFYAAIPMIETWIGSVRALVAEALREGKDVMRNDGKFYKLVAGSAGDRQWNDAEAAKAKLIEMGLTEDHIYKKKMVGPASIEELAKKKRKGPAPLLTPAQWLTIATELVTQSPGENNPVIALSTDPRPALPKAGDGFDYVDVPANIADLL
jgi:hypothetical protein